MKTHPIKAIGMDDWYTNAGDGSSPPKPIPLGAPGAGGAAGFGGDYNHPNAAFNRIEPVYSSLTPPASGQGGYGMAQRQGGGVNNANVMGGPIGGFQPIAPSGPVRTFNPSAYTGPVGGSIGQTGSKIDYSNEPPLLEELGINFVHIWAKTRTVMLPMSKRIDISYLDDTDLAGPLVFALILGVCLLFTGKLHFGYIYGFGLFGCVSTYLVLNLMSDKPIGVWETCSVLGYCLLPVVVLSVLGIALDLTSGLGLGLSASAVCWSCTAATKLFEGYLGMRNQRWLIAYPIGLLYCCFVLITIF